MIGATKPGIPGAQEAVELGTVDFPGRTAYGS